MVHSTGFVPQREQIATHSRYRYRLRKKGVHPASQDVEHNLWLIYYRQSEPGNRIHVSQLQIHHYHQQVLHDRMLLQNQGAIPRKDFMLMDRTLWPHITLPAQVRRGSGMNGPYPGQPAFPMGAPPGYPGHLPHPGPPAKRMRQAGPPHHQMQHGMRQMQLHELEVEEAEDSLIADWLDNMTPTAISTERFKRNHMWLDEVLSSVYAVNNILPEDLGFGLAGELADLTKDFLSAQESTNQRRGKADALGPIDQNAVYYRLGPENLAELEQKVADYIDAKQENMDDMRNQYSKRMAHLNKGKFYLEADQRLRDAGNDKNAMDALLRDVEAQLGIRVQEGQDMVCVQQGMLEQDGEDLNGHGQNGLGDDAAGLQDEFTSAGYSKTAATAPPPTDSMHLMDMDVAHGGSVTSKGEDEWVVVDNGDQQGSQSAVSGEADKQHAGDGGDAQQHGADAGDVMQESMFEGADFDPFGGISSGYEDGADTLLNFGGEFGGDTSGGLGGA
jgi:hypothetical protein